MAAKKSSSFSRAWIRSPEYEKDELDYVMSCHQLGKIQYSLSFQWMEAGLVGHLGPSAQQRVEEGITWGLAHAQTRPQPTEGTSALGCTLRRHSATHSPAQVQPNSPSFLFFMCHRIKHSQLRNIVSLIYYSEGNNFSPLLCKQSAFTCYNATVNQVLAEYVLQDTASFLPLEKLKSKLLYLNLD